jgi:HAD superfamily hydrolase (TIGR01490 family)
MTTLSSADSVRPADPEAVDGPTASVIAIPARCAPTSAARTPGTHGGDVTNVPQLDGDVLTAFAQRRTGARSAAFFDLDGTILAGASSLIMAREFHRAGLLSSRAALRSAWANIRYRLLGVDHARMERIRAAALASTVGWDVTEVRAIAAASLERVLLPRVHDAARRRITMHRDAGEDVWLVTTSGIDVVAPLAEHLGIDEIIATSAGIDGDGRYDGSVRFYAYGAAKSRAMRQVAEVRGYDLMECTAYSDSVTDLPMLAAVGRPVAIDADRALRRHAARSGWRMESFSDPSADRSATGRSAQV